MLSGTLPKPKDLKRDFRGCVSKRYSLSVSLHKQRAEEWPHIQQEWSSSYKFDEVPVLCIKVISQYYYEGLGQSPLDAQVEQLDTNRSIVPGNNFKLIKAYSQDFPFIKLLLPGSWNHKTWTWQQYPALWLVTDTGKHDLLVINDTSAWFAAFRPNRLPKFKIISEESAVSSHLRLHRKEDTDKKSIIELQYRQITNWQPLIDTEKYNLATLVDALNDKTGYRLTNILEDAVVNLRSELAKANNSVEGWRKEADRQEAYRKKIADDLSDRLAYLQKRVSSFFERAISMFDATKSASRHKVFAEFRKFLEEERESLTRVPIEASPEKRREDWKEEWEAEQAAMGNLDFPGEKIKH